MSDLKAFIKTQIQELLNEPKMGFEGNELAFLSSQCKNEMQIRDKIAWRLQNIMNQEYGDLYVVRREWSTKETGRKKVDLAILEMDSDKIEVARALALIEFKAQSIARPEPSWYIPEFRKDVKKMRDMIRYCNKCKDADLYFVFLETGQSCKAEKYKSVLGYAMYQNGTGMVYHGNEEADYLSAVKSHWEAFRNALGENEQVTIHEPKAISIGEAFGYEQFVSPLLIEIDGYN